MNSHVVEISIAGCVREMVRDPNPMSFFFIFFFHVLCVIHRLGRKTTCSASYGEEKPLCTHRRQ